MKPPRSPPRRVAGRRRALPSPFACRLVAVTTFAEGLQVVVVLTPAVRPRDDVVNFVGSFHAALLGAVLAKGMSAEEDFSPLFPLPIVTAVSGVGPLLGLF